MHRPLETTPSSCAHVKVLVHWVLAHCKRGEFRETFLSKTNGTSKSSETVCHRTATKNIDDSSQQSDSSTDPPPAPPPAPKPLIRGFLSLACSISQDARPRPGQWAMHLTCAGGLCWRPVLAACAGGLCWRPVLAACAGGLCWRPVLAACAGGLCWRPVLAACAGSEQDSLAETGTDLGCMMTVGHVGRMRTIDILVVDDHALVRHAARTLLGSDPNMRVVGEACDGVEALLLAEQLQPDVILMDIAMPQMNGIQATLAIHEKWPNICVILITALAADTYREISQLCGARAFLPKEAMQKELLPTLYRTVQAC